MWAMPAIFPRGFMPPVKRGWDVSSPRASLTLFFAQRAFR